MAETLRIFVSATSDLEAERGIIGRTLAELPIQVGAEIRRSSTGRSSYEILHEMIANCDRVYFLLGQDISAPAGSEWDLAWQLERRVLPLRRATRLTPAAQQFLKAMPVKWTIFQDQAELARIIALDLIDTLLHPTNRYGLNLTELELLRQRQKAIQSGLPLSGEAAKGPEGGGVILDPLRREPLTGVPLDELTRQ